MKKPLKQLQLEFATSLLHANAEQSLLGSLVGDRAQNRERIALYRHKLTRRWHSVLASAYPVVRSLLGEDFFVTLSREYGTADPARSGDPNRFGSRLAELLEAWPPTATWRYVADVARLEWFVHRASFAADAVARLADQRASGGIALHPAVQLLHTPTRAADRWLAYRASGDRPDLSGVERPQWMVVTRAGWIPEVVVVSPGAFAALVELREHATIGAARDAAFACDSSFDFERNWQSWVECGIVV